MLVLAFGHLEVGLFRYLVTPTLCYLGLLSTTLEKMRNEEESRVHLTKKLEFVESELSKSNIMGCNYFPGFDYFELVENRVVELDELHSEDGVHHFPDYSLLRLQKHMFEYYLDILKRCHRWQATGTDKTKITRKTIKNGQTRTQERKSVQEPEAKAKKSQLSVNYGQPSVKIGQILVNKSQPLEDKDPKLQI
ncbi:hypothetical protein Tco_1273719 [Tanacetum coccineum]